MKGVRQEILPFNNETKQVLIETLFYLIKNIKTGVNMSYKHFGVMLDCSRNAVMKVNEVKRMIDCLVKMGYDTLELYTEDTYEIEDEPYFGYMRGRYTAREIKEIDVYAKEKGVELIPCIQTLAHFTNLVKLPQYASIVDVEDILLIDEEKTYALIEKMFQTLAKNFTSRLVNIGMDEAHMVGLGKYLDKHGYENRYELILRHLNKVVEIAERYGFTPHMWSDMFFRIINKGDYYGRDLHIPESVVAQMPKNIELAYWDYYKKKKEQYDDMLISHIETGKNIWFAGGAWSWCGFAPLNMQTFERMIPAMESVRENRVENVLITMWGDNGGECSYYTLLPSLYLIRRHADGICDLEQIKKEFFGLFGVNFDDFMLLDVPNVQKKSVDWEHMHNPCKCLFYADCFMNSDDAFDEDILEIDYKNHAQQLEDASVRAGEFSYIFKYLASLCRVLEIKKDLSLRTKKAYRQNNKKALLEIVKDYQATEERIEIFHQAFQELWEKENKPFGWEVQDARIGGVIRRIKTCRGRIEKFVDGELDKIEELDEELLPLRDEPYVVRQYKAIVSVSEL